MPTICQITPRINKYGTIQGYWCFCVGMATFLAKNMKEAKGWAKARGLEIVK